MANNFIQPGLVLATANATGASIAAGAPIAAGVTLRVAINTIANGASGPAYAEGVFSFSTFVTVADAWADGAILYWDPATDKLTDVPGVLNAVAIAVAAKLGAATTANAKLWPFLV